LIAKTLTPEAEWQKILADNPSTEAQALGGNATMFDGRRVDMRMSAQ